MRISTQTITRNYTNRLGSSQAALVKANDRAITARRFDNIDEDVSAGLRALKVRRNIAKTEAYMDNIKEASSFYSAVESHATTIEEIGQKVYELYVSAPNASNREDEYRAFAAQIERYQQELLTNLNSTFSDRYLFGGSQIKTPAFNVDGAGDLTYTYKKSDGIYDTVKVKDIDRADPQYKEIFDDPSFIDIGLGMDTQNGSGIIPNTAFDRSVNGLDIIGVGENNMYDLFSKVLNELRDKMNPDSGQVDPTLITPLTEAYRNATTMLTDIGAATEYLDNALNRYMDESINLADRQDSLEFIPREQAIIDAKMKEYAYNAALQIGQSLFQPTLFNFIK